MKHKFGVVIAAGGTGSRFGTDIPKQFVEANGIPIIAHTLQKFEDCDYVSEIVIVVHKDYIVYCNDIVKKFKFAKVTNIIEGGNTRQQSVYKGIKIISCDYVLIHDAARPLVSVCDIERCCNELSSCDACTLASGLVDTIKFSEDGEYISSTMDRNKLWAVQTPQCFKRDVILMCHKKALYDNFEATDDCMIAEKYGVPVRLIEATAPNLKVTNYKDLAVTEVLLNV